MNKIQPVILSGGSGTRLWPVSRAEYPKHLIPLLGDQTLLQKTVARLNGLPQLLPPIVVSNQQHRFMVAEQLQALGVNDAKIVLEPVGRNTAPAIAIAAGLADPDAHLLVLPADHMICDVSAFQAAVHKALPLSIQGQLATFGVVATTPHTGYGYIEQGDELADQVNQVRRFVEKPDLSTAEAYVRSGGYLWNSGMFLFQAARYLQELQCFYPDIVQHSQSALAAAQQDLDFLRLAAEHFAACTDISIDYAVMEKTDQAVVIALDAQWSDVGSWDSLADICSADAQGNVVQGDVLLADVENCYVRAEDRLCAVVGAKNQIIVETPDAVMVMDKSASQSVKQIVAQLQAQGREERLHHLREYRPWGSHTLLIDQANFQVRRVRVKPHHMIAMQRHHLRTEHWVIVTGQAAVTLDGVLQTLQANESCYVPMGVAHQIHNDADEVLEFIEVQVGSCLKEDDIERL